MTDVMGMLRGYRVTSATPVPSRWGLEIEIDKKKYPDFTESTICFAVLQSATLTYSRWHITLDIHEDSHKIDRVRVVDNRADICKGTNPPPHKPDQSYLPLQPTFFGDENPPKWGFFFAVKDQCKEYKGISIDIYAVIERAWRDKKTVVLTLDGNDLIADAKISTP